MWEVVVDKDKCNGDEECVDACPSEVLNGRWQI
jgi:NAD-dependent dihydropyrimidine dehydrogenase PreA subunit